MDWFVEGYLWNDKLVDSIYKLFTGQYIDLSKIITISPYYLRTCNNYEFQACFQIDFQLVEKAKEFTYFDYFINGGNIQSVREEFEKKYDEFILDWKKFKQ